MISQFRNLNPANLILLAFVTVVLRVGVLLKMPQTVDLSLLDTYAGFLINVPEDLFSPFGNIFTAMVLVFIQAVILNRMVNNFNLMGKPTFVPALMYVSATAILEPFLVLSPALLANFLVLWMLYKFLNLYRRDNIMSTMFDLGMITAVGSLIYFPFIVMFPLIWVTVTIFRPFNWREWVAALVGFITIWFFVGTLYYLNGALNRAFSTIPLIITFHTSFKVTIYDFIVLLPLAVILVLSVFSLQKRMYRSNVFIRKSFLVSIFLFVFGMMGFSVNRDYDLSHFLLAVPPVSIIMSYFFVDASKRWFYETMYLLFAFTLLYFQFI